MPRPRCRGLIVTSGRARWSRYHLKRRFSLRQELQDSSRSSNAPTGTTSTTHPIRKGEQVRIKCWDLEETFYFDCKVLKVVGTGDDLQVIPKPRSSVVIQRRKVYRVHEPFPLSFTVIEAVDREMLGRDFPDVEIQDLKVGGEPLRPSFSWRQETSWT